jgi:hypothetical protein
LDGSGLALWSDVFPNARLIGLDLRCDLFEANVPTLKELGAFRRRMPIVEIFDAYVPDYKMLKQLFAQAGKINVVFDDGPHTIPAIARTCQALLPHLDNEFTYIVEDNPGSLSVIRDLFSSRATVFRADGLVIAESNDC